MAKKFFKEKLLLGAIEGVYGAGGSLTGANAVLTKNLSITPMQGPTVERNTDAPGIGNDKQQAVGRYNDVSFEVEIAGSGTAGDAPAWGFLLRACSFAEVVTAATDVKYQLATDTFESCHFSVVTADEVFTTVGARGTVTFDFSRDSIPVMRFQFMGMYTTPVAASAITPDISAYLDPLPVNAANTASFTIDAFSAIMETLSVDIAANVVYRNLVNEESIQLSDRKPVGNTTIEAPALATKNFYALAEAETLVDLHLQHGSTAGNIVELDHDRVQVLPVAQADSDGIAVYNMPLRLVKDASGVDNLVLTVR